MNGNAYSRRARTALILSPDALGAALLGAATELAGFRVGYPTADEASPDAIRRIKPYAVLVDAAHAIVTDPSSLGPALMTGAVIIFYGSASRVRDVRLIAETARASTLVLPDDIDRLPALLGGARIGEIDRSRSEQ